MKSGWTCILYCQKHTQDLFGCRHWLLNLFCRSLTVFTNYCLSYFYGYRLSYRMIMTWRSVFWFWYRSNKGNNWCNNRGNRQPGALAITIFNLSLYHIFNTPIFWYLVSLTSKLTFSCVKPQTYTCTWTPKIHHARLPLINTTPRILPHLIATDTAQYSWTTKWKTMI